MFMPGFLITADLDRMIPAGEDPVRWAESNLQASPGALVAKGSELFRIPTLVMAARENGYCIKLENRRCGIWENAPFGCAFFGCDMDPGDQERLAHEGLMAVHRAHWGIDADEPTLYRLLWQHLWDHGFRADAPEEKRARMAS